MPSITDAVYRYYESRRRVTNDARPEKVLQVQINKKNTARRSLQRQVRRVQITMQEAYALYICTLMYTFFLCSSMKENELRHWKEN